MMLAIVLCVVCMVLTRPSIFVQCVSPGESLKKSGRYCSKQYRDLCLWLAKNKLLLVYIIYPSSVIDTQ